MGYGGTDGGRGGGVEGEEEEDGVVAREQEDEDGGVKFGRVVVMSVSLRHFGASAACHALR